jgi:hypothetical protein|tara:strand:+ start:463 stop:657 length:195 start_codon:yes stop_codon:yes gene_type:complete
LGTCHAWQVVFVLSRSIFRMGNRWREHDTEAGQDPPLIRFLCLGAAGGTQDVAQAVKGFTPEGF